MTTAHPKIQKAIAHFTAYDQAANELQTIKTELSVIAGQLEKARATAKPDFAKVAELHFRKEHLGEKKLKAEATAASLAASYHDAGQALYNAANRARDAAGVAAQECVRARLSADFSGDYLEGVMRYHPVLIAEDARSCYVPSPLDRPSFKSYLEAVPGILEIIEMADARADLYRRATAANALPKQSDLELQTPGSAKPKPIKLRAERTDAEEAAFVKAQTSAENLRLERLYHQARQISGQFGENGGQLRSFLSKNREVAKYFPAHLTIDHIAPRVAVLPQGV